MKNSIIKTTRLYSLLCTILSILLAISASAQEFRIVQVHQLPDNRGIAIFETRDMSLFDPMDGFKGYRQGILNERGARIYFRHSEQFREALGEYIYTSHYQADELVYTCYRMLDSALFQESVYRVSREYVSFRVLHHAKRIVVTDEYEMSGTEAYLLDLRLNFKGRILFPQSYYSELFFLDDSASIKVAVIWNELQTGSLDLYSINPDNGATTLLPSFEDAITKPGRVSFVCQYGDYYGVYYFRNFRGYNNTGKLLWRKEMLVIHNLKSGPALDDSNGWWFATDSGLCAIDPRTGDEQAVIPYCSMFQNAPQRDSVSRCQGFRPIEFLTLQPSHLMLLMGRVANHTWQDITVFDIQTKNQPFEIQEIRRPDIPKDHFWKPFGDREVFFVGHLGATSKAQ